MPYDKEISALISKLGAIHFNTHTFKLTTLLMFARESKESFYGKRLRESLELHDGLRKAADFSQAEIMMLTALDLSINTDVHVVAKVEQEIKKQKKEDTLGWFNVENYKKAQRQASFLKTIEVDTKC